MESRTILTTEASCRGLFTSALTGVGHGLGHSKSLRDAVC